ncbi:MAG TPA: glucose-1-phosphate cytidylyltransferase [Deltaproteobacteria bacterium]|nr:glucose-1-phosphate cytidylyltransferase [Deltaproteobacteria bacterium]HCP46359.1 glucose-1-phosphate cytidylyltransferase [Deltaproteobacteria bacterium]
MPVVILCGGQGTRLKEETEFRPKPMVEVGGRPLLWHIMKLHAHQGLSNFVLALGFKGEVIRDFFLNYREQTSDLTVRFGRDGAQDSLRFHEPHDIEGWQVTLANTGEVTPTGGRIHRLKKYVADGPFLMTYGDGVADLDIDGLLAHHREQGRLATVTGLKPLSRFGVLEDDGAGSVVRFREKPRLDSYISGGFFVLEPGVFDYLNDSCVFEEEPLQRLAMDGQLAVYNHDGFWKSIDTYREYLEINRMWDDGDRPWAIWE